MELITNKMDEKIRDEARKSANRSQLNSAYKYDYKSYYDGFFEGMKQGLCKDKIINETCNHKDASITEQGRKCCTCGELIG